MSELLTVEVIPPVEGLGYSHLVPADWQRVEIPDEQPDFSQPVFMPLAVHMAPYGAVLFSVAARPAYEDGSVYDWLMYACRQEGFDIQGFMPIKIGEAPAVECRAIQQTGMGPMRMRVVVFEDGGRLMNMSAMAPESLWDAVSGTLDQMMDSFRLAEPRGMTAPLIPAN
jgi:hypothetical protein